MTPLHPLTRLHARQDALPPRLRFLVTPLLALTPALGLLGALLIAMTTTAARQPAPGADMPLSALFTGLLLAAPLLGALHLLTRARARTWVHRHRGPALTGHAETITGQWPASLLLGLPLMAGLTLAPSMNLLTLAALMTATVLDLLSVSLYTLEVLIGVADEG